MPQFQLEPQRATEVTASCGAHETLLIFLEPQYCLKIGDGGAPSVGAMLQPIASMAIPLATAENLLVSLAAQIEQRKKIMAEEISMPGRAN